MELTILKEKEIPLLERRRVTLTLASDGTTPSRVDVIKAAAKKLKTKEANIVVRHVYSKFGTSIAKAILHVYTNEEAKIAFERKYMVDKNVVPVVEPKKEAEPAPIVEAKEEATPAKEPTPAEKPATEESSASETVVKEE